MKTSASNYTHVPTKYGQRIQHAMPEDTVPLPDKKQTKYTQEVAGTFLYYAQAVNSTMLTALSAIAMEQAK